MRPVFHAELVNRPFGDPGIYIDLKFERRAILFDIGDITSLAFAFEESVHINVWKNRLEELQLPTGPWLSELKKQVRAGAPEDTPIRVRWRTRDGAHERTFALGELRQTVLEFVPGQRVCYVTDAAGSERNTNALEQFARDADVLFIEAVFLEKDREHAERKAHLTARAAGAIARAAGVRSAVPFHFSPRYLGREDELRREFAGAWLGAPAGGDCRT